MFFCIGIFALYRLLLTTFVKPTFPKFGKARNLILQDYNIFFAGIMVFCPKQLMQLYDVEKPQGAVASYGIL